MELQRCIHCGQLPTITKDKVFCSCGNEATEAEILRGTTRRSATQNEVVELWNKKNCIDLLIKEKQQAIETLGQLSMLRLENPQLNIGVDNMKTMQKFGDEPMIVTLLDIGFNIILHTNSQVELRYKDLKAIVDIKDKILSLMYIENPESHPMITRIPFTDKESLLDLWRIMIPQDQLSAYLKGLNP